MESAQRSLGKAQKEGGNKVGLLEVDVFLGVWGFGVFLELGSFWGSFSFSLDFFCWGSFWGSFWSFWSSFSFSLGFFLSFWFFLGFFFFEIVSFEIGLGLVGGLGGCSIWVSFGGLGV